MLSCQQQLRGAAITGLGQALLEELAYQDGLVINPNLMDYNLPRFLDVPEEIRTILVEHPNPHGPYGSKGVGETSVIPFSSAVANAIEDAIGVRIKDLPITAEKVLAQLAKQNAKTAKEFGNRSRSQKSGVRSHESGVRSQESGVGSEMQVMSYRGLERKDVSPTEDSKSQYPITFRNSSFLLRLTLTVEPFCSSICPPSPRI